MNRDSKPEKKGFNSSDMQYIDIGETTAQAAKQSNDEEVYKRYSEKDDGGTSTSARPAAKWDSNSA